MIPGPGLVVVCGPPCSGKSTLARALTDAVRLEALEMDRVRVRLLPDSTQSETDRDLAYVEMHRLAEQIIRDGHRPLLDATYARASSREGLEAVARATGVAIYLVECRVAPDLAVHRFESRRLPHPAVDLTPERVRRLAREYPYFGRGVRVEPADALHPTVAEILGYLAEGTPLRWDSGWSAAVGGAKNDSCSSRSRSQSRSGGSSTSS